MRVIELVKEARDQIILVHRFGIILPLWVVVMLDNHYLELGVHRALVF